MNYRAWAEKGEFCGEGGPGGAFLLKIAGRKESAERNRSRTSTYILLLFANNVYVHFIELHARSAFSFLEGSSLPEDLAARCAHLDQPAIAITDAHGVYGAPRFHLAAKKLGPRALIGAEVNAAELYRLTLLAENRTGYQNLCASSPAPSYAKRNHANRNIRLQPMKSSRHQRRCLRYRRTPQPTGRSNLCA
jgi:PHP domain-containing protein